MVIAKNKVRQMINLLPAVLLNESENHSAVTERLPTFLSQLVFFVFEKGSHISIDYVGTAENRGQLDIFNEV